MYTEKLGLLFSQVNISLFYIEVVEFLLLSVLLKILNTWKGRLDYLYLYVQTFNKRILSQSSDSIELILLRYHQSVIIVHVFHRTMM